MEPPPSTPAGVGTGRRSTFGREELQKPINVKSWHLWSSQVCKFSFYKSSECFFPRCVRRCVCVHKATGKNPSGHRQDQEDTPRTPMMQHRPLILRPENITRLLQAKLTLEPHLQLPGPPSLFLCSHPPTPHPPLFTCSAMAPAALTHRHQRAGSSQMACPLPHIAVGQALFLSLTL